MDHSLRSENQICPVCGGNHFVGFFYAEGIPAQDGVVWSTPQAARAAPTGTVDLAYCTQCSYISNRAYDPEKITFQGYDFSLHYSAVYSEFNHEQIRRLIQNHQLQHKTIMDVGCGKGHFLVELCQTGQNQGVGIDPSFEVVPDLSYDAQQIRFIEDYYSPAYTSPKVDFIACRHVMDELEFPLEFLRWFKQTLTSNPGGIYLEVPNALKTFEQALIWNIGYAKRSWFTAYSMAYLLQRAGFKDIQVNKVLDEDYLGVEARADFNEESIAAPPINSSVELLQNFSSIYAAELQRWKGIQADWQQQQYKVALWGAGMRGINFLSHFADMNTLALVIDINPLRQGKYLPKSGFQVSPPEALRSLAIDVLLISNATYAEEIKQQAKNLGYQGEFVVF